MKSKIIPLFFLGVLLLATGLFLQSRVSKIEISNLTEKVQDEVQNDIQEEETGEEVPSVSNSSLKFDKEVLISKVFDGDTIETNDGEKIRLIGINSPETGQPFSSEATNFTSDLVLNKKIGLELDVQTKDRYQRSLAYVYSGSIFLNLELVRNGLAVIETIQPNVKHQGEFLDAQERARDDCKGIWGNLCEVEGAKTENCVEIASINANAVGDDNKNKNGEWIEIENQCSKSVDMDNWLIKDNSASNNYLFKNFILEQGKRVFIYSGCGENSSLKLYWKCPEQKYAVWNNSSDNVFLYNGKGELVSEYSY